MTGSWGWKQNFCWIFQLLLHPPTHPPPALRFQLLLPPLLPHQLTPTPTLGSSLSSLGSKAALYLTETLTFTVVLPLAPVKRFHQMQTRAFTQPPVWRVLKAVEVTLKCAGIQAGNGQSCLSRALCFFSQLLPLTQPGGCTSADGDQSQQPPWKATPGSDCQDR